VRLDQIAVDVVKQSTAITPVENARLTWEEQ
jgi:hypothetical protein